MKTTLQAPLPVKTSSVVSPLPAPSSAASTTLEALTASDPKFNKDATFQNAKPSNAIDSLKTQQPAKGRAQGSWGVFGSTFVTIFLAEMGDKTQLATLLMSAESHKPGVVFAGAAIALISTSLLGVLLGRWLATRLAPKTLETSAGIILLFISASLLWDVLR